MLPWVVVKLRCAACGGESLSPRGPLTLPADPGKVRFASVVLGGFPGWLTNNEVFPVKYARICLDCGHVMAFVDEPELRKLREHRDRLEARETRD